MRQTWNIKILYMDNVESFDEGEVFTRESVLDVKSTHPVEFNEGDINIYPLTNIRRISLTTPADSQDTILIKDDEIEKRDREWEEWERDREWERESG